MRAEEKLRRELERGEEARLLLELEEEDLWDGEVEVELCELQVDGDSAFPSPRLFVVRVRCRVLFNGPPGGRGPP